MDLSTTARKEKKGLGKLWSKVKLALRSKSKTTHPPPITTTTTEASDPHSRPTQTIESMPSTQSATPAQPTAPSITPSAVPTMTAATVESQAATSSPTKTIEPVNKDSTPEAPKPSTREREGNSQPGPSALDRDKADPTKRYKRTQAMFEKYDVDFEESSWDVHPKSQVERVYKAPRIRVRWTCHECKTTFGHDRICVECAHHRCGNCARYPPKKKKAKAAKMAAFANSLNNPANNDDVQEGACHECQTTFEMGVQECSNCHHRICDRCLQETLSTVEQAQSSSAVPS